MGNLRFANWGIDPETQQLTPKGRNAVTGITVGSGIAGLASGIMDAYSSSIAAKTQAQIASMNAAAEEEAYRRDIAYMNEKAAREGWAERENIEDFADRQRLLSSLSGSSGAGEERIIADTYEKSRQEHEVALRALNAQSFERWRGSQSAQLAYRSQAAVANIYGKNWLLKGTIQGVSNASDNVKSSMMFFNNYYKWARDNGKDIKVDEKPLSNEKTYTQKLPWLENSTKKTKSKKETMPWLPKNKSYI